MEVTRENLDKVPVSDRDKGLLGALLDDMDELNSIVGDRPRLRIDYQDWHDEYSPERTDPCPDYYGTYALVGKDGDVIGFRCTLEQFDEQMCTIIEFAEYIFS